MAVAVEVAAEGAGVAVPAAGAGAVVIAVHNEIYII